MKIKVLASLAILASTSALAGTTPVEKTAQGHNVYSACVYQTNGVYSKICDSAQMNKRFAGDKDKYGCTAEQVVIKSTGPIEDCPVAPAQL